jgi:chromate reductase, NAD(P)H dehydrogenase (quinone)
MSRQIRLLAISGSLRAGASNTALLEAAALVAPANVTVDLYRSVASLPAFNPDLDQPDGAGLPTIVAELRERIGRADGLLLSSPEYAHGIPGSLKNLLDWLVGSLEFPGKPVALISGSARGTYMKAQLMEVLTTMSARIVGEAWVTIEMAGKSPDASGIADSSEMAELLRGSLSAMERAVGNQWV